MLSEVTLSRLAELEVAVNDHPCSSEAQHWWKTLVRVCEAYTSKTDSRTGEIKQIGGAKTINGLDRDVNGSRGILLRGLTRAA